MTTKDAATERRDPRPSDWEIADAIEILSMCEPIRDIQGGMWFSRNHNLADATFVDYGACRAFARAARALPHLVDERASLLAKNADLIKALESVSTQCGNVIFNCEQRPADNERHLRSWRSVQEFVRIALGKAHP